MFTTLVQDWKAANGYAVYRLDMIGDGCLKWGIQMYMMYTLIHDDSYGMLQHGLNLQPNFPVWSIGILFMTWSCPSRTSWSKGTKIQFAQASGIWSEYSEWPPWNGNCYICYRMPGKAKKTIIVPPEICWGTSPICSRSFKHRIADVLCQAYCGCTILNTSDIQILTFSSWVFKVSKRF